MHGALATEQFGSCFVHEPDADGVHPDFRPAPANPEHQMGPRVDRGEASHPHVLEDAKDRELALLIDQGVISQDREIDLQGQATRIEVTTSFRSIRSTTSIPCVTWPNTVCSPSRCRCGE